MIIKNRLKITGIIPVASMSDIAFLLLIFMLLTSILAPQPPIKTDPPKVRNTAEVKEEKGIRIYLNSEGLIAVNENIYKKEALNEAIAFIGDNSQQVFLYAGNECLFEDIHSILTILKEHEFEKVTLICREDRGGL